jgi:hypothetical protein
MKEDNKTFEYLGKHFTPVKRLSDKQLELKNISSHLYSDKEMGFSKYEWQKVKYSYQDFYNTSNTKEYDLFKCEENGNIYIPCENELFKYI